MSSRGLARADRFDVVLEQHEKLAEIHFQANPNQLQQVRNAVRAATEQKGCEKEVANCIVLAVDEACTNVIRHGYGEHNNRGHIILEIYYSQGELVIHMTDFARPVNKKAIQARDLNDIRPGGLGVHLISEIMDEFKYLDTPEGVGNILEMRKRIAAA